MFTMLMLGAIWALVGVPMGIRHAQERRSAPMEEFQRAISIEPDLEEAQRLAGLAYGRKGEEARGFYHLAVSARLRGDLAQALSHFEKCDELEPDGTPRKKELADAIDELEPIVRERMMEQRERRRGAALDGYDGGQPRYPLLVGVE